MIKQLFHKLPIKPLRIEFANLDSIGGFVPTPNFNLIVLRKPKFLRKKFNNKLAKVKAIETQMQELKTTNTAVKVLTKAMMFYTKYHPDAKELEINSAISFLNNQNAETDKALDKLENLIDDIEKSVK